MNEGWIGWGRLTAGLFAALIVLALAPEAWASFPAPPVPQQPTNGAAVTADTPLTFTVQAPAGESLYLSVSKSPATDSSGRIDFDQDFAAMYAGPDATTYSYSPSGYTFQGWYAHTPGVYYWQASYFACDNDTFQCAYQNSPVMTLTVVAPPPIATTQAPSLVTATTARLNGTIDTKGLSGSFYFQYGSTAAYGGQSGLGQASATDQGTPVYLDLPGLSPASRYHYRLVLSTASGTSFGADQVVDTAPADHVDRIPSWIGRQGRGAGFYLDTSSVAQWAAARFKNIVDRSARRWGLRDRGPIDAEPATARSLIDGVPEVGFSYGVPRADLGQEILWYRRVRVGRRRVCRDTGSRRHCHRTAGRLVRRIYDHDVALNANVPWSLGPWYPNANHFDLESVVLHELGHFAGNPRHEPRCTNSPMVEALGPGEFWRAPGEWFEYGCGLAPDRARAGRARSGSPLRIETVWRELPPDRASGRDAHTFENTR
jgi:hypothetical protein